jgi:hypothetical protein
MEQPKETQMARQRYLRFFVQQIIGRRRARPMFNRTNLHHRRRAHRAHRVDRAPLYRNVACCNVLDWRDARHTSLAWV